MIDYHKKVLDNGLTIIAEQDNSTALAAVNILYRVGSKDEDPNLTGFAHLFEHLMFGGSKHVPNFDTPLQNVGGENNAFTNTDNTNFYIVLPAENIETAFWLEADRMAHFKFSTKSLSTQKRVVIEEFKEVCLNVPYGDVWHHLSSMAYKNHPYQWPTIGKSPEHIEHALLKDVKAFFRKYYHPGNAILSVSAPIAVEEIFVLAEKWFGHIPGRDKSVSTNAITKLGSHSEVQTLYSDVPGPMLYMAFHMPGRADRDYYVCDLITDILAGGKSSRMYRQLVKKEMLVSQIDCFITGTIDPGLIIIEAKPMPDVTIEQVSAAIWQLLEEMKTTLIDQREIEKISNKVITTLALSDLNVLNKAISMASFEYLGLIESMNTQEAIYESISPEELRDVASRYFQLDKLIQLNYLPTVSAKSEGISV